MRIRCDLALGREPFAVFGGDRAVARVDEIGKRIPQPEFRRPGRALWRGAEQPRDRQLRPAGEDPGEPRERVVGEDFLGGVDQFHRRLS